SMFAFARRVLLRGFLTAAATTVLAVPAQAGPLEDLARKFTGRVDELKKKVGNEVGKVAKEADKMKKNAEKVLDNILHPKDAPFTLPKKGEGCFKHFQADKTAHDMTNAYLLALCSDLVYAGSMKVKDGTDHKTFSDRFTATFRRLGMKDCKFIRDGRTDTEAMVMSNDRVVIVSFRGSES